MFKTNIRLYDDPTDAPLVESFAGTISEYIMDKWPDGIPSADFCVFKGQPSLATLCCLDFPDNWADLDGDFSITLKAAPAGFIVPFIPYIIGAVAVVVAAFALKPAVPSLNTSGRAQQSPNNSLEKRSNQPRVNQRTSDIFGDERATFDLLSVPTSEFVDNEEFEAFFSAIGRGRYQILDFKDGTTPLSSIQNAAASVFGPFTSPNSGDAPEYTVGGGVTGRLMTAARVNSVDGQSIEAPNEGAVSFTGATATVGGVVTMPPEFTGDLSSLFEPGDELELSDAWFIEPETAPVDSFSARSVSGVYDVTSVTSNTIGLSVSGVSNWTYAGQFRQSLYVPIFGGISEGATVYLSPPAFGFVEYRQTSLIKNPKRLRVGPFVVTDSAVDTFRYNIIALNGLYRDDGTVYPLTVDLELTIERLDSAGDPTGDIAPPYTFTLTGRNRDTVASTYNIANPFAGFGTSHTIRRLTDRPSTDGQNVSDEIKWRDFFTFRDDVPEQFGDITTAYVRIRATDSALRVKERVANARVIRLIPQLGQDWTTPLAPLTDFASICSALARDPKIGRLDAESFDAQVWALERDRLIAYFGAPAMAQATHTFDDTNITFEESIQLIASACFCQAYRQGSVVRVLADLPQADDTALFCHRNKHPNTDRRNRSFISEKRRNGVQISYKSRLTDAMETYTLGVDNVEPSNASEIEIAGIRTKKQAVIHARRRVNRLKYQRLSVEFYALSEGRLIVPTSRVAVVNNTQSGTMDGEVKKQDGLNLTVSQPVAFKDSSSHSVILSRSDGTVESIPVTAADGYTLTLSRVPSEAVYSGYMKAKTRFAFGSDSGAAVSIRVESITPDDVNKVKIQGVNYSAGYFDGDLSPLD